MSDLDKETQGGEESQEEKKAPEDVTEQPETEDLSARMKELESQLAAKEKEISQARHKLAEKRVEGKSSLSMDEVNEMFNEKLSKLQEQQVNRELSSVVQDDSELAQVKNVLETRLKRTENYSQDIQDALKLVRAEKTEARLKEVTESLKSRPSSGVLTGTLPKDAEKKEYSPQELSLRKKLGLE